MSPALQVNERETESMISNNFNKKYCTLFSFFLSFFFTPMVQFESAEEEELIRRDERLNEMLKTSVCRHTHLEHAHT